MSSRIVRAAVGAATAALLLAGCGGGEKEKLEVNAGLAARVGDVKITQKEIDDRIEKIGPQFRSRYTGREGRARYVDTVIDEELLYLAARETDLRYDDEVKEQLRQAEKNVLITAYYDREIRQKVDVTEKEIEQYYNEHWEEFLNRAIMKAQHLFSKDSLKVAGWKRRIDAGEKFNDIAGRESEDETTAATGGNLGYFNPGGYVKFYGESKEFFDQIAHLEAGEISDVIVTKFGYSLVRINDKKPESPKPLSEVRAEIVEHLKGEKARTAVERELAALKDRHKPVNFVREEILETMRSPEQLWEMAQEEETPYARIQYYRNIVNHYPDHQYASQALFMIGFVYAEELQDLAQARRTFEELIKKYPEADVVESAQWMIDNLNTPHPKFESIEQMQERMRDGGDI
ncbi:MAG: peptidyl-prolyl cis-trans isomerase [Candidatus Krumholzibacteria bacterium]|nr:peptidyl-prolyl cis-trans isomerase [Candidatus Krumholzibacteria bacterium]